MTQLWEIVGGSDKGGILVRKGEGTNSEQEHERLATGSLVQELDLRGDRLHFKLLNGAGPALGWVSVKLKDKHLAVRSKTLLSEWEVELAKDAAEANQSSEESLDEQPLSLYIRACEIGGGAKYFTGDYVTLLNKAAKTAESSPDLTLATQHLLTLMCLSAVGSAQAYKKVITTGDVAFDAFLTLVRKVLGSRPMELTALKTKRCTGKLQIGQPKLQMMHICQDCAMGPLCVECYLQHAEHTLSPMMNGVFAPTRCCNSDSAASGSSCNPLEEFVRRFVDKANIDIEESAIEWPFPWQRFAAHISQLKALDDTGKAVALGVEECAALRELHFPEPAIKTKTLSSGNLDVAVPSRLVIILHGGMQTQRHLDYMFNGIFGRGLPGSLPAHVVGIEADFPYEALGAGLSKPAAGFNYLRFESAFSRIGELVCSAARIYTQCIETHLTNCPACEAVDLIGFSAGGLLSWILLCMMPPLATAWKLTTLTMLSPRLEDMFFADEVFLKKMLKSHATSIYLAWGELEDSKEAGAPFTTMANTLRRLGTSSSFRSKTYANVGHTMPIEELQDVHAFLHKAWS